MAETLVKRIENPERRWVEKMLQETTRLIKLVGEWLDLTQLEANPLNHLKYEKIELLNLIDSVWQTLEPIAQKKQVTLKLTGKNPSLFFADKFRLIQVFMNLLENAIKHSPERETIVVQVSQKPVFNDGKS